jgi:hypothetical protein
MTSKQQQTSKKSDEQRDAQRTQMLALAKRATQHATQQGKISFGAPVSSAQMLATVEHFKSRDIVKTLKFKSAKQLSEFASGRVARASLDKQTQLMLSLHAKQIADALGIESNKFWTRKLATCAHVVHESRKTRKPRKQKTTNVVENANASE